MSVYLLWFLLLIPIGVTVLLFFSYRAVSRSITSKHQRRTEIQKQFETIIAANRMVELDQVEINEFLHQTSDINEYFSSPVIPKLRQEIFEHSHRLSDVQRKILNNSSENEIDVQLIEARRSLLTWFEKTNTDIIPLFESSKNPNRYDVLSEAVRVIGRFLHV